ncbi:radical S-adenosyl methionine domain-containing protein 1 [Linnemannia zychae]|nr:radical S-adenosyl methionine domain-containing protein 1 [Linnemannia zychae]
MERALITELKSELTYWSLDQRNRPIRSIYFGETLKTLRSIGINRYSLGIQSFQDHILTELGRDHSGSTALKSLADARTVWPGKVSMDLIMGHSGQTLEDWIKELHFTMRIVDDHLSLYQLTVERGTANAGFEHYEVSNFARNKAYSIHNSGHWLGVDYLGIGPGAHGRITLPQTGQKFRTFNVRDPAGWMRECEDLGTGRRKTVEVGPEDSKRELLVLGMRTRQGVDFDRFARLTGQDLLEVSLDYLDKDATTSCIDAGLLKLGATSLSPTEGGMAVADELSVRLLC